MYESYSYNNNNNNNNHKQRQLFGLFKSFAKCFMNHFICMGILGTGLAMKQRVEVGVKWLSGWLAGRNGD